MKIENVEHVELTEDDKKYIKQLRKERLASSNKPTQKKLVVIESPLKGDYVKNREYAKKCMLDSLRRGEAPYASHLLFDQPGLLDDTNPDERELGMLAGFAWGEAASLRVFYIDLGMSDGMKRGAEEATKLGQEVQYRLIDVISDIEK